MLGETQKAWLNTQHVLDRGIKDVVAMTGDIHTFFAGQITSTGRVDGTPAAVEFVGGSITSLGVEETFQDAPPGSRTSRT